MCAASGFTHADEPSHKTNTLRVLTYNIHHGEGMDGRLDLARIASVIRSAEPDIVALQEVDQNTERTGKIDQPTELSRLTGMDVVFGDNIRLQGGSYGNAVLSRFPIKRHENHPLPPFDKGERRGLLEVEIELPGERSLLFFATHLDHQQSPKDRNAAAEIIARKSASLNARPALLAGDLNDGPSSTTLAMLGSAGWTRSNKEAIATVPVKSPLRQIDFILFRPEKAWRVIETRVLEERVASDHRGVLAVIELSPSSR
ncbi:endonuclease/exonuclease/phosphatase family protein [bacterium]|nr:endonuclease/exonuclease/phosphatase family protein [bacterium]